ncbi:hypothetical protein ANO14919_052830 [Xylariales sp. No.14919]|nr:hypothetical protein ANO14919_052830 [Xylariales sp. No.14919]
MDNRDAVVGSRSIIEKAVPPTSSHIVGHDPLENRVIVDVLDVPVVTNEWLIISQISIESKPYYRTFLLVDWEENDSEMVFCRP